MLESLVVALYRHVAKIKDETLIKVTVYKTCEPNNILEEVIPFRKQIESRKRIQKEKPKLKGFGFFISYAWCKLSVIACSNRQLLILHTKESCTLDYFKFKALRNLLMRANDK